MIFRKQQGPLTYFWLYQDEIDKIPIVMRHYTKCGYFMLLGNEKEFKLLEELAESNLDFCLNDYFIIDLMDDKIHKQETWENYRDCVLHMTEDNELCRILKKTFYAGASIYEDE